MRKFLATVRATALETASEPLSLLTLISALALATCAPALHYHQFGEPSRMARDAGISALLVGGIVFALFGAVKTIRRELESGTAQVALAHSVSRGGFFIAKCAGVFVAYAGFAIAVSGTAFTVVNGAEIGGKIAANTGAIAKLWGPSLAIGVASFVLPPIVAAALNRFAHFRFVLTAFGLTIALAVAGSVYRFDPQLALRLIPVLILAAIPAAVLITVSGAFAIRFRSNQAVAASAIALAVAFPAIGSYAVGDALTRGGTVPLGYFLSALAAAIPLAIAFLALGIGFFETRDA